MTGTRPSPLAQEGPRTGWRVALRYVAIAVAALAVLGVVVAGLLWWYAGSRLEQRSVGALERASLAPIEGTFNVLAVGTDSREGLTEEELQQLGTEPVDGERADTVILVHVSPERPAAVMVSFPRDLRVDIPGRGKGKLNAALAYGGPDLLVRTVEGYSGIEIDHYVQVNIAGFLEVVDVLGGVDVCLDEPLEDEYAGADIPAGCQVLRGADAAGYVRARHTDPRGDIGRIERQQRFIEGAMRKITSAGTLVNPLRVKRLIDAVAGALVTDDGFGTSEMARVAWNLRELDPEDVEKVTVPGAGRQIGGAYYFVAEPEPTETIFQAIRTGAAIPGADTTPTSTSTPEPSDVTVSVLNGAGVQGLARRAADELEGRGFVIADVGNAPTRDGTVVRYAPGDEAAARLVATQFRGADLEETAATEGIVVVLGREEVAPGAGAT